MFHNSDVTLNIAINSLSAKHDHSGFNPCAAKTVYIYVLKLIS